MIQPISLYKQSLHLSKKFQLSFVGGFTLMELLIAVAIVSILAVVGTNQYFDYIRNSRVSVAQQYLTDIASYQESYYLDHKVYSKKLPTSIISPPPEIAKDYNKPEVQIRTVANEPDQFVIVLRPKSDSTIMNSIDTSVSPYSMTLAINSEYQKWYERANCQCSVSGNGCTYDSSTEISWSTRGGPSSNLWGGLACRTSDGSCSATAAATVSWACQQQ